MTHQDIKLKAGDTVLIKTPTTTIIVEEFDKGIRLVELGSHQVAWSKLKPQHPHDVEDTYTDHLRRKH